jgi:hypothetical protein
LTTPSNPGSTIGANALVRIVKSVIPSSRGPEVTTTLSEPREHGDVELGLHEQEHSPEQRVLLREVVVGDRSHVVLSGLAVSRPAQAFM